jgi:hypothetical protein
MAGHTQDFKVMGVEEPPDATLLCAVVEFGAIQSILRFIKSVDKGKSYPRIDNALARKPTLRAIAGAADIINQAANDMGALLLARERNIFWATTATAFTNMEADAQTKGVSCPCTEFRNILGLGHIEPYSRTRPRAMFVFEALRPLAAMRKEFRVARPTTIDGFSNPRFRQIWGLPPRSQGSGVTVHLKAGFGDGAPEFVATAIPIRGNFRCRFLGNLSSSAPGTDDEFLDYLKQVIPEPVTDLITELKGAMP